MTCPFKALRLSFSGVPNPHALGKPPAKQEQLQPDGAAEPAKPSASSESAVCPYGFSSRRESSTGGTGGTGGTGTGTDGVPESAGTTASSAPAAVCPYGFSGGAGASLTPLQCSLCRTFLHACVSLQPCTHKFCRFCCSRFRDCPVCGADVQGLRDEPELQGQVDVMLAACCPPRGGTEPTEAAGAAPPPLLPGLVGKVTRPSFFLQLGTQAMVGGNLHAAFDRLELCRQELVFERGQAQQQGSQQHEQQQQEQEQQQQQQQEEQQQRQQQQQLAGQLGAVLGLQAECCRMAGDADAAVRLYRQSMDVLRPYVGVDSEAAHSLSVTLNKLGDLHYYSQDLPAAAACYVEALAIRRALVQGLGGVAAEAAAAAAAATATATEASGSATSRKGPAVAVAATGEVSGLVRSAEESAQAASPATAATRGASAVATGAGASPLLQPRDDGYSQVLDLAASLIKVADALQAVQQEAVPQPAGPQPAVPQPAAPQEAASRAGAVQPPVQPEPAGSNGSGGEAVVQSCGSEGAVQHVGVLRPYGMYLGEAEALLRLLRPEAAEGRVGEGEREASEGAKGREGQEAGKGEEASKLAGRWHALQRALAAACTAAPEGGTTRG